jgi:sugar phosphate isomerase/epimerase
MELCLFVSTPDMNSLRFVVKVLTGTPADLACRAVDWGYDGIEFMPNPENIPEPHQIETALKAKGAVLPVVNTGRLFAQGMALLPPNMEVRRRSIEAFKMMLIFATYFRARVGLGIARGDGKPPDSGVRPRTRRVCRWRDRKMVLRRAAAALIETEKNFRKIMGYRDLWMLKAALDHNGVLLQQEVA